MNVRENGYYLATRFNQAIADVMIEEGLNGLVNIKFEGGSTGRWVGKPDPLKPDAEINVTLSTMK